MPRRRLDSAEAEVGRRLKLVELLAPRWRVRGLQNDRGANRTNHSTP